MLVTLVGLAMRLPLRVSLLAGIALADDWDALRRNLLGGRLAPPEVAALLSAVMLAGTLILAPPRLRVFPAPWSSMPAPPPLSTCCWTGPSWAA